MAATRPIIGENRRRSRGVKEHHRGQTHDGESRVHARRRRVPNAAMMREYMAYTPGSFMLYASR